MAALAVALAAAVALPAREERLAPTKQAPISMAAVAAAVVAAAMAVTVPSTEATRMLPG